MNAKIDPREQAENIEVKGSHLGLGHNHRVIWIVANRLAQNEGMWQPYGQKAQEKFVADGRQAQVQV